MAHCDMREEEKAMDAVLVVDCDLRNGRGYVVMSDAHEFDIIRDWAGLHIRAPYFGSHSAFVTTLPSVFEVMFLVQVAFIKGE
jgi:hypothetical protein